MLYAFGEDIQKRALERSRELGTDGTFASLVNLTFGESHI